MKCMVSRGLKCLDNQSLQPNLLIFPETIGNGLNKKPQ